MSSPQGIYVREGVMFSEKPDIETKESVMKCTPTCDQHSSRKKTHVTA